MLSNLKGVTGNIFTEFEYKVNVQNHEFWWVRFQNQFIKNYFTEKLREFYFTKGSQDQFWLQYIQSAARNVF